MSFMIKTGKLVVGNGEVLEDVRIGVQNGIIKEVANKSLTLSYLNKVDATGMTVMPGLIDTHVHVASSGSLITDLSEEYLTLRAAELAKKSLKAGVTTIGDAGGWQNAIFALRDAINDGVTLGPRIKACGSMITMTGGRAKKGQKPGTVAYEVDGENESRKAVRELLLYYGADFIKLGATGAMSNPITGARDPQLSVAEMRAAVEEATKCGKNVHAHCYGEIGISNSLDAGVNVIVHGQSLNENHIRVMKQRNNILVPTLWAYRKYDPQSEAKAEASILASSKGIIKETEPNFRKALKEGITIAAGTDITSRLDNCFGEHPKELVYMVEWGMSENGAIQAGTLNGAKALGIQDVVGSIEVGKYADLLILNNDPIKDIKTLVKSDCLERIMINGKFVENKL